MDPERGGEAGREGERMAEDDFTCADTLRGSLASLHLSVERTFGVTFGIGTDDVPYNDGQMWLNLRGPSHNVAAAKLFVRGLVNEEQQQEVSYPGPLHCVFCGAQGLFMDCLIKSTSANIVVGSHGCLLISGLTEQVVQAYSLITDLLERFQGTQDQGTQDQGTQDQGTETGRTALGKSLDSSRAFNCLVRKCEDKHTTELLALPGVVKQSLLTLVKESGHYSSPGSLDRSPERLDHRAGQGAHTAMMGDSNRLGREWGDSVGAIASNSRARLGPDGARDPDGHMMERQRCALYSNATPPVPAVERPSRGLTGPQVEDLPPWDALVPPEATAIRTGGRRGVGGDGAEQPLVHAPQEMEEEEAVKGEEQEEEEVGDEEVMLSVGSRKEFRLLLKFFNGMGYTEQVVRRVLARTGVREASQILDLVQQEQDHSDKNLEYRDPGHLGFLDPAVPSQHGPQAGGAMSVRREPSRDAGDGGQEDFVLAVLKRAAASCGYREEMVEEVYSNLPDLSTHQLILQLQREEGALGGPRENMNKPLLEREARRTGAAGEETRGGLGGNPNEKKQRFTLRHQQALLKPHVSPAVPPPDIRGPPLLTYPSTGLNPPTTNHLPPSGQKAQTSDPWPRFTYAQPPQLQPPVVQKSQTSDPLPHAPYIYPQPHQPPQHQPPQHQPPHLPNPNPGSARVLKHPPKDQPQGFLPVALSSGPLVTGEQRFLEGLRETFDLQLPADAGDPGLRMIIIDGSNVAMSHGLGHFFSCRGIALAVQHFWNRGHRRISTFLPQWRQKRDPKNKEQHYLTELQDLGLLSYTPSREVLGKRINSYDDRFMLQLAQQSDGVIVTNDNLRDLLEESHAWLDIIKKRLLQYTFVGDLFMVPDDPLGRGGPHLDHFLRSQHRTPDSGSHFFAGLGSSFPSSELQQAKTEVMQYRVLTPGGTAPEQRGPDIAARLGQVTRDGAAGPGGLEAGPERGMDETARLRESLCHVFPGQDSMVGLVLQRHPAETDINFLSHVVLEQQRG
ncbi:hypothetical protein NHX12_013713 [Muraenolepis orangiensis]|uniref:RNase NYN domain-containing protein n=1 Tax=Muraenolepis orangiensis TaxID=630683 RepID=A0A9Q0DDG5_9TELE|nr:hypothetical protein NHX12_013713 [Muraenolepis orangiensis]